MDDLLPYYERELVMLRQFCREFSERFPETASRLYMSGDTCDDPHIERKLIAKVPPDSPTHPLLNAPPHAYMVLAAQPGIVAAHHT